MIDDHETYGPFGIRVARDDRVPRDEAWLMPPVLRPSSATHRVVRRVAVDPAGSGPKATVLYVELVHERGDDSPLVIAQRYSAPGAGMPQLPPVTVCPHCRALVNGDGVRLDGPVDPPGWARPASWLRRWIIDGRDDERQRVDMDALFAGLTQYASPAHLPNGGLTLAERLTASPEQLAQLRMRRRVLARRRGPAWGPLTGPANRAAHTGGQVCRTRDAGRLRHPVVEGLRRLQAQMSAERYIGSQYADPRSFARIHGL